MKVYYKLVRDRIPEIIGEQNTACTFKILTDEEYLIALDAKLDEELAEYRQSGDVEELADLVEVIYAIAKAKGRESIWLDEKRRSKANERGRFNKKIMLLTVEEKEDG